MVTPRRHARFVPKSGRRVQAGKELEAPRWSGLDRRAVQAEARACCIGVETSATSSLKRRGRGELEGFAPA